MKWKWVATFALYAGSYAAMYADTLNYTWSAPGSGTFDGVAFNNPNPFNDSIVFTMTANSANAFQTGPGSFEITGPVTVAVAGLGTDTITDSIDIYESYSFFVMYGLLDTVTGSGFNIATSGGCFFGCQPYDNLSAPLAPTSGRGNPAAGTFHTGRGSLVFTGPGAPFYTTPTFQITEASTAVTPEPSSCILLGSGALSLVAVLRRRCGQKIWPDARLTVVIALCLCRDTRVQDSGS